MDLSWFHSSLGCTEFLSSLFCGRLHPPWLLQPFLLSKDILYFDFAVFDQVPGSCIYIFSSESAGGSDNITTPKPSEPTQRAKIGGPGRWVWLGPILGAVATLGAAFLIVYLCTRRRDSSSSSAIASHHGEEVVNTDGGGDFRVSDRPFWRWTAQG